MMVFLVRVLVLLVNRILMLLRFLIVMSCLISILCWVSWREPVARLMLMMVGSSWGVMPMAMVR